jgi:hypothetical protein
MKQDILAELENFRSQIRSLKKELSTLRSNVVSRKSLRNSADTIANIWVEDLRSALEHKFHLGPVVISHTAEQINRLHMLGPLEGGDALSCGLARPHGFIGGKPIQVTASHGPGIESCRCSGNTVLDA